jgi:hypothetical protein
VNIHLAEKIHIVANMYLSMAHHIRNPKKSKTLPHRSAFGPKKRFPNKIRQCPAKELRYTSLKIEQKAENRIQKARHRKIAGQNTLNYRAQTAKEWRFTPLNFQDQLIYHA